MTAMPFRADRRDIALTAALAAAPLYRGRILRGLIACHRGEGGAAVRRDRSAPAVPR